MVTGWVHTVRSDGRWATAIEGQGAILKHESRAEALQAGAEAAKRLDTTHVVHAADGSVIRVAHPNQGSPMGGER